MTTVPYYDLADNIVKHLRTETEKIGHGHQLEGPVIALVQSILFESLTAAATTNPRQKVYDALSGLSDAFYLVLLSVIRPVNRFVGNAVVDDPTPLQKLEDAIKAEYERFGVPKDE